MDPVGHPQKLETVLICLKLSSSEVAAEGGIHSMMSATWRGLGVAEQCRQLQSAPNKNFSTLLRYWLRGHHTWELRALRV